jgi:predicted PurR-regulated permease PerM
VKVALFVLLVHLVIKLVPLFAIFYVATMLAVVMAAATSWLQDRGLPRAVALTLVAVVAFGAVLVALFTIVPAMVGELRQLITDLPTMEQRLDRELPAAAPYIRKLISQLTAPMQPAKVDQWLSRGAMAGLFAIEALAAVFLTLILSVFLVLEGKRALAWLFSFAPLEQRHKLVRTAEEVEPVMRAYMRGQLILSSLAGGVALITLTSLHVSAAMPIAVLTFIGDFFPVVGFIASIVPAVLLALVVSPVAAIIVIVVYVAYHIVENYYVVPHVFGRAMRLSFLAVLVCFTVGAMLAGPFGAILILPIASAYPAIERIWLRPHLAPDTIPKHEAIEGEDAELAERVAEDVMKR